MSSKIGKMGLKHLTNAYISLVMMGRVDRRFLCQFIDRGTVPLSIIDCTVRWDRSQSASKQPG